MDLLCMWCQQPDDGGCDLVGCLALNLGYQANRALRSVNDTKTRSVPFADDRVKFPVAETCTLTHNGGSLVDAGAT